MILNHSVKAHSFIYCSVYQGPNETTIYHNSGNGHFHQDIYIAEGKSFYTITDTNSLKGGETFTEISAKNKYDLTEYKDKYVITQTKDIGCSMMMFNPIPDTKKLDIEIVDTPGSIYLSAGDERITIVCITGPITIKNKQLSSMQYSVIFPNTTQELIIPENSICAIVTG
jgi:hypothetical protein